MDGSMKMRIRLSKVLEDGTEAEFDNETFNKPIDCNGMTLIAMSKEEDKEDGAMVRVMMHNITNREVAAAIASSEDLRQSATVAMLSGLL